jgi:meso-butanediol dehydrogenase/(S,S)-butanediol dehydrogenase/diacetyl reductase
MKALNEAVVLITGGLGGIGRACVRAFLDAGARVAATDTEHAAKEYPPDLKTDRYRFLPADIRLERGVERLVADTVDAFGSLDVLINNAAIFKPMAPVHKTTAAEFDALLAVNLRGVFLCCKYAYPHLQQSKGCIINISSMAGMQGEKNHAVYCATKGAINSLTKAMAIDYGPDGVRCNAICPSSVLTPNTDKLVNEAPDPAKVIEKRKQITLLGYTAKPEEIASVAVFLASPAASFMTGAIVPVSGGSECGYGVKP